MATTVGTWRVRTPQRLLRLTGSQRVWLLTAALSAATVVLYATALHGLPGPASGLRIPWPLLAVLFALAEVVVVNVQVRRDAHSISLGELPLILGLFFASPAALLLAQLLGTGAALKLHRKQPALKLGFNLAHFAFEAAVAALLIAHVPSGALFTAGGWLAAFAATGFAALFAVLAMCAAMSMMSNGLSVRDALRETVTSLAGAWATTSLALLAVWLLSQRPAAMWLLLAPGVASWSAYRAWVRERDRGERLRFLYDVTQSVSAAADIEQAVRAVLIHAREMFRADVAEITLFAEDGDGMALRTTIESDAGHGSMRAVSARAPEARFEAQLWAAPLDADAAPALAARGFKDAMRAPLAIDEYVFGELVVADRVSDITTFDDDDLRLMETLAAQASVCLENGRLEKTLAQLTTLKEQLRHQAFHDSLTGLVNRALLHDRVEHALATRQRAESNVIVLLLDLDDFKAVNDSLGHAAGDELLIEVAGRLTSCLRPGDTAARLGGDEFAILVEDAEDVGTGIAVAERILAALQVPVLVQGIEASVHASIGIARSHAGDDALTLLRNADVAMYEAKQGGKNRYGLFEHGMHQSARQRLELRGQLRTAIDQNQFTLRYQPYVDLSSGVVVGVEALVRWHQPSRGLLAPEAFIAYAEETGLIVPVGTWVLDRALEQLAAWRQIEGVATPLTLAVNLSPRQLSQPGVVIEVRELLLRHAVPADCLVLEITESALIKDTPATVRVLRDLKALGVRIAIDDFGTGYSALSYLRQFPIDMLKISKAFVDDVRRGPDERALTEAIVRIAQALRLQTIAEGVEHEEQRTWLDAMGCTYGQGFHFSVPLAAEDFTAQLLAQAATAGGSSPMQMLPQ